MSESNNGGSLPKKPGRKLPKAAIGCLVDVVLMVFICIALKEDTMVSAIAYMIIFTLAALALGWILNLLDFDVWGCTGFAAPAIIVLSTLMAIFKPIEVEDGKGGKEPATPHNVSGKVAEKIVNTVAGGAATNGVQSAASTNDVPHWLKPPPPGIKYVAASTNEVTVEEALAELNELIGLKPVKEEVGRFAKFVRVAQQRKEAGLKVAPISYHMVFTGNPGTGKTTVARIMAKIYKALGVVKNGHLVECDRGGLVAGYTGQTAIKTAKVIDFALDGILFIDEAYSLVNGPQDSFGDEAISTLLKRMEDDRDRLVVIVAGYSHEMKKFIDANSGLASRFNHYVEFPDYTTKELAEMFRMNAKKSQYTLSADVEKYLDGYISIRTAKRDRKFGNGRWVRNLFEHTVEHQAVRVADIANPTKEQLMTITLKDVGIKLKDPNASLED